MARPRLRFRLVILGISLLGEIPIFLLLAALLRRWTPHAFALAFAVCALATVPMGVRLWHDHGERFERGPAGVFVLGYYVFWATSLAAGVYYLPLALLGALLGAFAGDAVTLPAEACYAGALLAGLLQGVSGLTWRRTRARFPDVDVPLSDLPLALDGYRIAQLSDLHVGPHTPPERLRGWVDRVNALDVDLVAVTGDLITTGDDWVEPMARELGRLRARDGVALCMGNHDYFTDAEALVRALTAQGIDVLRNRGHVIGRGERRLYLAGVDDTWQRRHDVARALAGRPPELPAILLAHDPNLFPPAAALGASLVLSGHTHGGQITVPFAGPYLNLARLFYRYVAGLYRLGASCLYVCRGAGTTGPPIRIGSPAEIPILHLRRAGGADR